MNISTGAEAATEPKSLEEMAESLIEPTQEEEHEATDAPDLDADQTEGGEDNDDTEDGENPDEVDESPEGGEDDDDTGNEDEEPLFTVKVDGKDATVTLDELKRGYSGQQYIQRGMQEVAQARKEAEAQMQTLQQHQQQLAQLMQAAQNGQLTPPTPPDPELLEVDPIGYMQQKAAYDTAAAEYQQHISAFQQQQQYIEEQQRAAHEAYVAEQRRLLQEAIPELADKEKAPEIQRKIADVGVNVYGFTLEELQGLSDSRYGRALYDLVKYHEMLTQKEKAMLKARKAPPVAKAGAKTDQKSGQRRKQRERLKQTGSIEDALSLMFEDPNQ